MTKVRHEGKSGAESPWPAARRSGTLEGMSGIQPTSASADPTTLRQIPSLRAARAPDPEAVPLLGSGERRGDRFRLSGRTPLDADRRLAERLAGAEASDPRGTTRPGEPAPTSESLPGNRLSGSPRTPEATDEAAGEGRPDDGLTEEQEQQVRELEKRDAEVRAHEQAHMAAAGALAQGGPKYTFETGPDGKRYATGGEVNIVMKSGRTPEETLRNAQQVQAAALAPGDPSPTDQRTAAAAARMAQEARQQLADQAREKASGSQTDSAPKPA